MHRARTAHVVRIVVNVIEFVWVFFADAFQGETGEVRGFGLRERELILCYFLLVDSSSYTSLCSLNLVIQLEQGLLGTGLPS